MVSSDVVICNRKNGVDCNWMDTRDVLVVNHAGSNQVDPDYSESEKRLEKWFSHNPSKTIVATGFIACTPQNIPTTLKRDGSDFSAAIMGAFFRVGQVTIWTDVNGVYSADPSKVALQGVKMVAEDFTVDLNKALVFQVGHLGESYQEWVHKPIISKESPQFFENDVLEFLTLNDWWVIPLIWFPVVCWFESMSMRMGHELPQIALMVVTGIFIWTLLEYMLHRFLFHIKTKSYWTNTLHYLLHGCHHKHPQDALRLVFPPAATAILLVLFWHLVRLVSTPSVTPGLVGGGLLGYVLYDMTHYYLHHGQPTSEVPRYLKRYHLNHHFRIQTTGFGITSSFWDIVFGTLPETKSTSKSR